MRVVEILKFFLATGWVAKVVLAILVLFSLGSWSVILAKWRELSSARKVSDRFLKVFRKATRLNEAAEVAPRHRASPLAAIFQAGYTELEANIRNARRASGPDAALTVIKADRRPSERTDEHLYSVRTRRWRYILYNNGAEELYDHDRDPYEWTNLADDAQYAETKARL